MDYNNPIDLHLVQGCCREAERADLVALGLEGLRNALPDTFRHHITAVSEEVRGSGRVLRDLADNSQVHYSRVPVVLNYLNIILPCLSKSLRDITEFYEDRTFTKEIRWRKMYHKMTNEVGGLPLPARFQLYNLFLTHLRQLLTRSPNFDLNSLDTLRGRIMQLRESRGIPAPPPAQVGPVVRADAMLAPMTQDSSIHWAENIFSLPLPSRTALKHVKPSRSMGPHVAWGQVNIPSDSTMLFRRTFDDDRLALMVFLNAVNKSPYLLLRTYHMGAAWFALRGAHELRIQREGSSLQLKRWSVMSHAPKLWAALHFQTWEEMVLFYCTFVALKARNTLTLQIHGDEYRLSGEKRLFQAQIIDDGFKHSLIVYEDKETKGIRLHAAVWEGELRQCPVWTAFVTHQSASATWLHRRSKRRIWLKDVQLYVFCQRYRQQNQRQGKAGAFEIYFVSQEAAQRFKEVFSPPPSETTATTESSDSNEPTVQPA